jgi:hypothetical protein
MACCNARDARESVMNAYDINSRRAVGVGAFVRTREPGVAVPMDQPFGSAALRNPGTSLSSRIPPSGVRRAIPEQTFRWNPPTIVVEDLPGSARQRGAVGVYGIGWFGVFVAWLATVTLGIAAATNLAAHGPAARHNLLSAAGIHAALPPPVTIPSPRTADVAPAPPPLAAAPPLFRVTDLPKAHGKPVPAAAPQPSAAAHARAPARQRARMAPPTPVAENDDTEATSPAKVAPPPSQVDEPAVRAVVKVVAPAPRAAKAAPVPTFAPGSLEDLIRKEVEKEQKGIHRK